MPKTELTVIFSAHATATGAVRSQSNSEAFGGFGRNGSRGRNLPSRPDMPEGSRRICQEKFSNSNSRNCPTHTRGNVFQIATCSVNMQLSNGLIAALSARLVG